MARDATRRDVLGRGLLAASAAAGAAGVSLLAPVRNAFSQVSGDQGTIAAAVGLEQSLAFAYDSALRSGRLDAGARAMLALLHAHEREHVAAMLTALEQVAGTPPPRPRSSSELQGALHGLATALDQRQILAFAGGAEALAVAAYVEAQQHLEDARTIQIVATIMGSEAQHLVMLRDATGADPLPHAFESGLTAGHA